MNWIAMNNIERKVLSYISDGLGSGGSILSIAHGMSKKYGNAYYPNIYNAVIGLEKKGVVSIIKDGKNRSVRLALDNPLSVYYIGEAESWKAADTGIDSEIAKELLSLALEFDIITICILKYREYIRIGRIEILIIVRLHGQDGRLAAALAGMESAHNSKIDPIILTPQELSAMLEGSELNRVKELISDKSIFYNSDGFWEIFREYRIDGNYANRERFPEELTKPQLAYNYNRFGYALYEDAKSGTKITLEDTIFFMSTSEETRIRYGAIVLLYKNSNRLNISYLYYLFKRHDELGTLKGMLESLKDFYSPENWPGIEMLAEAIQDKKHRIYDKNLIKKYIEQYG
jgi:hypothetical protein